MRKLFKGTLSALGVFFMLGAIFIAGKKEAEAQSGGCCYLCKWYAEYGDCWPTTVNCLQTVIIRPESQ